METKDHVEPPHPVSVSGVRSGHFPQHWGQRLIIRGFYDGLQGPPEGVVLSPLTPSDIKQMLDVAADASRIWSLAQRHTEAHQQDRRTDGEGGSGRWGRHM